MDISIETYDANEAWLSDYDDADERKKSLEEWIRYDEDEREAD